MRSNGIHFSLALLASVGLFSLTGCGGGDGDGDSARLAQIADASKNTVTSIAIADNEQYVHYKGFYQFELLGNDGSGNAVNLTKKATWKISDPSLGKIKDGYFTPAGGSGDFTLTAEYAGLVATQQINVSNANLTAITVSHPTSSVEECRNTAFTAQAQFDNGKTLPYPLTWRVTQGGANASFKDPAKSTLNTTNGGTVIVVAVGVDNAGAEVMSAPYNFTVSEGLTRIDVAIDRSGTELKNGESANVTIKGIYGDPANPVDIAENASLTAAPTDYLTFEGTKITAKNGAANGSKVTLTAACGGASGTQDLTIKEREVASIDVKANDGATTNLRVRRGGDPLDFKATATFVDASPSVDDFKDVTWSIDFRNAVPADQESRIKISSTGELQVDSDLSASLPVTIYVKARVNGKNLEDNIAVSINP